MDHIDFIKSIDNDNLENNIKLFFDQIMALYNLIGVYQGMDISTEIDDTSSIRFIMVIDTEDEAKALYTALCDKIIPIYDHKYIARLSQTNNSLNVELVEEASG